MEYEYEFVKLVRELRRIRRPPPFPEIARDVVGLFNLSAPDFWLESGKIKKRSEGSSGAYSHPLRNFKYHPCRYGLAQIEQTQARSE